MNPQKREALGAQCPCHVRLPVVLLWACLGIVRGGAGQFEWQRATPESQGVSPAQLEAIRERMATKKTRALLVVRNDRIVCEWYAPGVNATTRQGTASLAKALVGGLSLAVAMQDGKISPADPAARFIPQWRSDPRKAKITIRHLGSHTSGLEDAEAGNQPHEQLTGWKGDFWKRLDPPRDPFTLARDETPMIFEAGTKFQYSNPGIETMTYCVTAAIRDGEHKDARTLLRERLLRPIGVPDAEWSAGYSKTFSVDDLPLVASWGGAAFTPRATARLGRLVLREGNWEGRQLFSREIVRLVTADAGLIGNCGMGWWSNGGRRYDKLSQDAVWGAGAGDQLLLVVPSLDLIMVRNGETLEPGPGEPPIRQDDVFTRYHNYRARVLFEPLVEAAPYPPSQFIAGIQWAPKENVLRKARGSDNWPLTWAEDDWLYTAYGDGHGFEPFVSQKLSLGFAKIGGSPQDFSGANIRSPSGEQTGQGREGRKASGILCVDRVLYLWARNAGNAQLAWSSDHAKTWQWADWKFTSSFGCPTFLNFGRNYARAPDSFAYVYSPDTDSAYSCLGDPPKKFKRCHDRDAEGFAQGKEIAVRRNDVFSRCGQSTSKERIVRCITAPLFAQRSRHAVQRLGV